MPRTPGSSISIWPVAAVRNRQLPARQRERRVPGETIGKNPQPTHLRRTLVRIGRRKSDTRPSTTHRDGTVTTGAAALGPVSASENRIIRKVKVRLLAMSA